MTTTLSLHQNKFEPSHLDYIRNEKPTVDLILNPSDGQAQLVKDTSPNTNVITRIMEWRDDSYIHNMYLQGNPEQAGESWAQTVLARIGRMGKYAVLLNEPPCDPDSLAKQARAEIAFMKALDRSGTGIKAGIGTFSGGNLQHPSIDNGAEIRAYAPALEYAKANGHALFIHLYFVRPAMGGATPSGKVHNPYDLAFRWRQSLFPYMRANGIAIPDTYVTEYGLDLGFARDLYDYVITSQGVGYKVDAPWGYGTSEQGMREYASDLVTVATEIGKDSEIKGFCIFCAGDNGDERWRSFMVDGYLLSHLQTIALPQPTTTTPPAPPPTMNVLLNVPYVSQRGEGANESANDCGAATVKSTVLINRATAPTVDLLAREAAGIEGQPYPNYNGLQMTTLIELGRRYDSKLTRYKPTSWQGAVNLVTNALKAKRPLIALVHYDSLPVANRHVKENGKVKGHYIVLLGATDNNITYHDPYHDGNKGKGLKLTWAQLRSAWEANPADNNPKYDMLIMQNPQWDAPPVPTPAWTQRDAATATWFTEQLARALRGDTGAMNALIGAIQAEPKRQGLHNVIVAKALPPLVAERDK